jgi:carbon storage regulator
VLVLTRKANQSIMIGDSIEVSVLSVLGEKVRLGIQAPRDVPVFRTEVFREIQAQNLAAAETSRQAVDAALELAPDPDQERPGKFE